MEYYPYNSRDTLYRNRLGALAEGNTLRLKLLIHNDAKVHKAFLRLKKDGEKHFRECEMSASGFLENYRFYECEITPEEGLYWYSFRYTSDHGEMFVTKTHGSLGTVSKDGGNWQLTVYEREFKTPDWLAGGIIYQIFPDRFCSSGEKKSNIPSDRYLCDDWEKQPEYRLNNGKYSLGNDYYGGDFKGIESKLGYLKSLGVTCIYLNPIFEAHSNHRYNTADYLLPDPLLGSLEDFESLIKKAEENSISIILDGVFSHTGDDSRYFNKNGRYETVGAYNSANSPYYSWYKFSDYPNGYSAWWGVPSLPETDENDLSFSNFITGENGVIRYWLKKGVKGWRLDVADELPDEFLDKIRTAVKAEGDDNYLLGEVWEDATNKISYGFRRRFLRGRQLDSVMNYPLANAIIDFIRGANSEKLLETVLDILENYPPQAVKLLMNHIGTHDTERLITRLTAKCDYSGDRSMQAVQHLTEEEYKKGIGLVKVAAVLQYTLPGVPSLYYGDEAGNEGYSDPFCRGTYPWGKENQELLQFYRKLGNFRTNCPVFKTGEFIPFKCSENVFSFFRKQGADLCFTAVNRGEKAVKFTLPADFADSLVIFGNKIENRILTLDGNSFAVVRNIRKGI